jgi:flagellar basal body-associated protein FliL
MEKLLPILNVAFAAIGMIVSIVVLVMVLGLKASIITPEMAEEAEAIAEGNVPLSELEQFNMTDGFILTMDKVDDKDVKVSVVFKLGFAIHIEDKNYEAAKATLTAQGSIIKDRIQKVLQAKDSSHYKDLDKQDQLKEDIRLMVNELIGNEAIKEVYFIDFIYNEK